jgi:ectoine hydroxylase-related dioxygenase (phytanoyl-CoA dioxygenase family)
MPYWSFFSPHALSQWIALDDATKDNGCMYFHPSERVI